MSEAPEPSHDAGRRRRRRRLSHEKLLQERIANHLRDSLPAAPPKPENLAGDDPGGGAREVRRLVSGCFRILRIATRLTVVLYLLCLLVLTLALNQVGQSNVTAAALMYLPPWIWIAPAFLMLPLALLLDWKSTPLLVLAIGGFMTWHLDYQWRAVSVPGPPTPFESIRVLTWNRGQGKHASLRALKAEVKPDFILLQDAAGRGPRYRADREYTEFREIAQAGEFVLLSRWPVLSAQAISSHSKTQSLAKGNPCAARFVVLAAGTRITLYSVHLPSPRDTLESYKRGSFLWGVLGLPGTPWEAKKKHYQTFWDEYMALATDILDRVKEEDGPVLVMGDFNTPAMGPIYRLFEDHLQDAHLVAGSGLGFTFPGDTRNPLALFQPWLRLDQMFASSHWQVLNTAPQQANAQHLPVFGEFKLTPRSP